MLGAVAEYHCDRVKGARVFRCAFALQWRYVTITFHLLKGDGGVLN
jgi:hypothetical protein